MSHWRIVLKGGLLHLICLLALGVTTPSFAGKPTAGDGVYVGNGFPSGPHFNLNISGKKENFTCPPPEFQWTITGTTDGHTGDGHEMGAVVVSATCPAGHTCTQGVQVFGNVVFVPRTQALGPGNTPIPIEILMESGLKGPKSAPATTDLQVTDWCSQQFDGDAASLRLPKDPEGYAVYGRILGKPGADGGPTFDFVSRNLMLVHDEFGNDLILLGLVNETGAFDPVTLTRYNSGTAGKGALKAVNITPLFEFSGEVCYINDVDVFCPDLSGANPAGCSVRADANGVPQPVCCVPVDVNPDTGAQTALSSCVDPSLDGFGACVDSTSDGAGGYLCPATIDFDGVDPQETACPVVPVCKTYAGAWIFNIADFVNVLFGVENDGSYLVQLRFYPLPLQ